ncbi:ubiquitin-conjugating enzyme E2, putative [Plasmodium vinckei]|uniref:Ubiquitin-conjugating enzyme E2 PEX4, putative n=6 Tax=Plasmodium (Vinckeia) TaxID=418101 RepID=A0A077TGT0_PLACU|nr:ubiquitin-conjugating enzyme E2 PEX4, putative [Plasmodium chabaudi chabaudi]CAD2083677.1 ubiquitin-conjugating enzyme E2, putative [Plasmodium vinckei brucechwatti]CAD2083832.1 ubiquitin-conjugating enzyme E2, putative [Plasmodium vinckei lentum]CAD2095172.1 ubiquitin-conjugating enzyme E2, putative [Plasmodium vinckei petteri]CAD2095354.1 ubiquitin-conjugating enzyme E2, putative [Plasmodium vinckei]SCM19025.1 ubiquitin-conjugating enzyme E2, putative [Plasmodium chabaudi adami]|eukprot:XP_016652981.1 ubiquitin-conjugating enzyme E2, putative [Plasmodium chabaudi chabaudi]
MAKNRLLIESREAKKQNDPDIFLSHSDYNLYEWEAVIRGPKDSPYEGGKWKLSIKCKNTYPIDPPLITFITKVFHPNVNFTTGALCMDILKTNWSPAWTIQSLCRAILFLLNEPNAESPLNCDAGNLIRSGDIKGFKSMAKMYTKEYAS